MSRRTHSPQQRQWYSRGSSHHPGTGNGGSDRSATRDATFPHPVEVTDTVTKSFLSLTSMEDIWEVTSGWEECERALWSCRGLSGNAGGGLRCCEPYVSSQGRHCPNGRRCPNVHVNPALVLQHRDDVHEWMVTHEEQFEIETSSHSCFKVFIPEVNEVCDVPAKCLSFTRGLYLLPEQRAKRGRGSGAINSLAATSCKLYGVHPSRCSWGKYCNQAHVSGKWLQSHCAAVRRWFRNAELEVSQQVSLGVLDAVHCHDPTRKRPIRVPSQYIAEATRGLLQHVSAGPSASRLPSVCMLFLAPGSRCTAGQRCNQVHIKPEWMDQVWATSEETSASSTPPPAPTPPKLSPMSAPSKEAPTTVPHQAQALPPSAAAEYGEDESTSLGSHLGTLEKAPPVTDTTRPPSAAAATVTVPASASLSDLQQQAQYFDSLNSTDEDRALLESCFARVLDFGSLIGRGASPVNLYSNAVVGKPFRGTPSPCQNNTAESATAAALPSSGQAALAGGLLPVPQVALSVAPLASTTSPITGASPFAAQGAAVLLPHVANSANMPRTISIDTFRELLLDSK